MSAAANTRAGELLREAARIVDGPRNATHGGIERSFEAIANLWDVYLDNRRGGKGAAVTAADVTAMMVLLKFARSMHGQHVEDHGVDAAGYAERRADGCDGRSERTITMMFIRLRRSGKDAPARVTRAPKISTAKVRCKESAARPRRCLRCECMFPSWGPGNRRCDGCSSSVSGTGMPAWL